MQDRHQHSDARELRPALIFRGQIVTESHRPAGNRVAVSEGMRFTKILCPIDFSPTSSRALQVAVRLAKESAAELAVVHAWYIPPSAHLVETPFPPTVVQEIVDTAKRDLDAAAQQAADAGVKISSRLLNGVPWAEIVGELERNAFDLCVMGTHGRTGLARVLLGSVAEKVIRHAPCPVLAVRPDGDVKPFAHVLVATDLSESAEYALDLAAEVVEPGGTITLVHVVELPIVVSTTPPIEDFARDLDRYAADALEREAARVRGKTRARIVTCSRIGSPGSETLHALDEDPSIDLAVLGSHGRTGIKRVLLGSIAEKVARHARCSVLVARPPARTT